MGLAISRGAHSATEQLSVWSSVQKYFVPTRAQRALESLSVVLGARYYLREAHWQGIFQKMLRDNALVALFDGSTVVNLTLLGAQLPELARRRAALGGPEVERAGHRLGALFDLAAPLPPFDPGRIRLASEGDDILLGARLASHRLAALDQGGEVVPRLRLMADEVVRQIAALDGVLRESGCSFELARRHCALHAACACLLAWLHNRGSLGSFFARGEWLALALARLLAELAPPGAGVPELPAGFAQRTWRQLLRLHAENRQFSLVPIRLARAPIPASLHTALNRDRADLDRLSGGELDALAARLAALG
jgi:hypothetical protein